MNRDFIVSEWYNYWIETYKRRKIKPGTIETYGFLYRQHIRPRIGEEKVSAVDPLDLQTILNDLCDGNYADQTIHMTKILLNGIFKQAYKCGLIEKNPCEFVEIPNGKPKRDITVFTKREEDIFLEYTQWSVIGDLFRLALYTGMRGGELFALQWDDVNFKEKQIHVSHTLHIRKGGECVLGTPKSASSIRDIPMLPAAEKLLLAKYRQRQHDTKNPYSSYVFTFRREPIRKGLVSKEIKAILQVIRGDGIDFPDFTLHTTRHSFATRCIEAGMKPVVLQKILGHSSLSITMDTYVCVQDEEKREQMQLLNEVFH